jgi:hypothetical protein
MPKNFFSNAVGERPESCYNEPSSEGRVQSRYTRRCIRCILVTSRDICDRSNNGNRVEKRKDGYGNSVKIWYIDGFRGTRDG